MMRCSILIMLAVWVLNASAIEVGDTGYAMVNIWYENPDNIPSTNYHRGDFLPVGTPLTLARKTHDVVVLEDSSGAAYTIIHNRGYVSIPVDDLVVRLLTSDPSKAELTQFSDEEQASIRAGEVVEGMSRDAVIAAYGYPPTHKTPSLNRPVWRYWDGRIDQRLVYFQQGKVSRVEKYYPGSFLLGTRMR